MNCDFYAVREDLIALLDYIYSETDCRIYESYSEYEKELREFKSTQDLVTAFALGQSKSKNDQILLQLYSPAAKGSFSVDKINLDPRKCQGHTIRYRSRGWGLIQLYMGGIFEQERKIVCSHLGHNTELRAKKWALTFPENDSPEAWDWKEVHRTSRKISNYITKKLSGRKDGSRSILLNAAACLDTGYNLGNPAGI